MAYRFIEKHQRNFGTRWLLKRIGIFPNAYYNYLKQAKAAYHAKKSEICRKIKDIYHEFGGILGYRSMRVFLARDQILLSKTTVHKYMNKELQLQCVCRRKRPGYKKGHAHKIFPNLLNQNFVQTKPIKSGAQILHMSFLRTVLCVITVPSLIYTTAASSQAKPANGLRAI